MDIAKIIERRHDKSLTRREFKQLLASVCLGVITVPMVQRSARAEGEVMYFGWAGYETPDFHPAYTEEYGYGGPPEATFWATMDDGFQNNASRFYA